MTISNPIITIKGLLTKKEMDALTETLTITLNTKYIPPRFSELYWPDKYCEPFWLSEGFSVYHAVVKGCKFPKSWIVI